MVLSGNAVIDTLFAALRQHPELAVFLTLAIGFQIGRLRFGTFSLGNVVGTLLAGVVVGQIGGIKVDPMVRVVFFDLFLFATGYKVGPQFFRGLGRQALAQASLTVVLCVTSLGVALLAARVMHYDMGTAAGLMAGAFTESTVIGTAGDAIRRLSLPAAEETRLLNNIPVAYAVSYLVGTTFVVWMLSNLAPRLLRIDLRKRGPEPIYSATSLPGVQTRSWSSHGSRPARRHRLGQQPQRRVETRQAECRGGVEEWPSRPSGTCCGAQGLGDVADPAADLLGPVDVVHGEASGGHPQPEQRREQPGPHPPCLVADSVPGPERGGEGRRRRPTRAPPPQVRQELAEVPARGPPRLRGPGRGS